MVVDKDKDPSQQTITLSANASREEIREKIEDLTGRPALAMIVNSIHESLQLAKYIQTPMREMREIAETARMAQRTLAEAMVPNIGAMVSQALAPLSSLNMGPMVASALAPLAGMRQTISSALGPITGVMNAFKSAVGGFGKSVLDAVYGAKRAFASMIQSVASWAKPSFFAAITGITGSLASVIRNIFRPPPWLGLVRQIMGEVHKTWQRIAEYIFLPLRGALAWLAAGFGYWLVQQAAKGSESAQKLLTIRWVRLIKIYNKTERLDRHQPNEKDFFTRVQNACVYAIDKCGDHPTKRGQLVVVAFDYLLREVLADYGAAVRNRIGKIPAKQRSKGGDEAFYTKTLAEELGVSQQTIRNWIKDGEVDAELTEYYFESKRMKALAYLVPSEQRLLDDLEQIRTLKSDRRRHRKAGLSTVSQIEAEHGIDRKTLYRWHKKGLLVPAVIENGIRYYTPEQKDSVPALLATNRTGGLPQPGLNAWHSA